MIRQPWDLNLYIYILDIKFSDRDISREITIFKVYLAQFVSSSVSRIGMGYRSHTQWTGAMR